MNQELHRCVNCGASLSLDQLRGTNCPFCNTAFPHHARAVEHAALVNQVMAQQFQQVAPYATPPVVGPAYGAPPPTYGGPGYGGPPPGYGAPNPYGHVTDQVQRTLSRTLAIVGIAVFALALLVVGVAVALVAFSR